VRDDRRIQVTRAATADPLVFEVVVREKNSETRHQVTATRATLTRLAGDRRAAEHCIEAAFRFLLDREPKESILARFDVSVISRYFPDFESALADYL
jgi:hypothetical protein